METLYALLAICKDNPLATAGTPPHPNKRQTTQTSVLFLTMIYRKVSNIRRTLAGNYIVDNSDVVGASPVGAAPTTSSFST